MDRCMTSNWLSVKAGSFLSTATSGLVIIFLLYRSPYTETAIS
jgi:hypothetical protein